MPQKQEVGSIDELSSDQVRNMVHELRTRQLELDQANAKLQEEIVEHQSARHELEEYSQRQDVLNALLQLSIQNLSLEELLKRCIEQIIAFPGLGLEPSGIIFLKDKTSKNLVMKAHCNISAELLQSCSSRPFGECHCGRAAVSGKVVFAPWQDACQEVICQDMHPHGYYCVPIIAADKNVLGVLTLFTQEGAPRDMVVEGTLVASTNLIATIIERTTVEASLGKQNELISAIYDAANSVALVTTALGKENTRITSFSPGAEQIFGYSRDEVVGQSMSLLTIPKYEKAISAAVKRLKTDQKLYFPDIVLARKSGEHFAATVTICPLSNGCGKIIGALGVCFDISNLKMIQAKLEQANDELEKRVEERTLELQRTQRQVLHVEKLGVIGRLAASIAHEFNNPMQGIVTVLNGIAKRAPLEDEDMGLLRAALDECMRIKGLIRSLQDFNRPSSGKREPLDLQKATDSLLLLCKKDCKQKRIKVITDYGKDVPHVMAVSDQIKQVILNLLTNATDACPNGGTIYISTRQKGSVVRMQIRDTGIGISPENMEHIFEPFFTTKPDVKGTGLGLSISYGIIKEHNGRLGVESKVGKGTTFTITLPVRDGKEST